MKQVKAIQFILWATSLGLWLVSASIVSGTVKGQCGQWQILPGFALGFMLGQILIIGAAISVTGGKK